MLGAAIEAQYRALLASKGEEGTVKDSSIHGLRDNLKFLRAKLGLTGIPTSMEWIFEHFEAICNFNLNSTDSALNSRRTYNGSVMKIARLLKGKDSTFYKRTEDVSTAIDRERLVVKGARVTTEEYAKTTVGSLPLEVFQDHVNTVLKPKFEKAIQMGRARVTATGKRDILRYLASCAQVMQPPLWKAGILPAVNLRLMPASCKIVSQQPTLGPKRVDNYLYLPPTGNAYFFINDDKVAGYKAHPPGKYQLDGPLTSNLRAALRVMSMPFFCGVEVKSKERLCQSYGILVGSAFKGLRGKSPSTNDLRAAIITHYVNMWDKRQHGAQRIILLEQSMRSSEREFKKSYYINAEDLPSAEAPIVAPHVEEQEAMPTVEEEEEQERVILPPSRPANIVVAEGAVPVRVSLTTSQSEKNKRSRLLYNNEEYARRKKARQYVTAWNRGVVPMAGTAERYSEWIVVQPQMPLGMQYKFVE